jgi:hypothetical protein
LGSHLRQNLSLKILAEGDDCRRVVEVSIQGADALVIVTWTNAGEALPGCGCNDTTIKAMALQECRKSAGVVIQGLTVRRESTPR